MRVEVLGKRGADHAGEHAAEPTGPLLADSGRACKVLDENGTGKTVLACARYVGFHLWGHTRVGLFVKPQDVEYAAAVSELGEERLDGMDGMQELEAICWLGGL